MNERCQGSMSGGPRFFKGLLLFGLAGVLLRIFKAKEGRSGSFWEKMQQRMEQMPENFPPRVMFDTVMSIKEDTTRILELLEKPTG